MSNLPIQVMRALDNNGDPISGGKLSTFIAGTTTNKATYTDEALTSANANPVIADGNGLFPEIYLTPDEPYKLRFTDASDVTIWEVDNINAPLLSSSGLSDRVNQLSSSPLDQGAVGDGVADESTEVQAAITAAAASTGGDIVELLGKTFRCDSALTVPSGVTIRNGTLDFTNCGDDDFVVMTGEKSGVSKALTVAAAYQDTTLTLDSVSGISKGDLIGISSSGLWTDDEVAGELAEVESISGLVVTLRTGLSHNYATAGSSVSVWSTVDDVVLDNILFQSAITPSAGPDTRIVAARTTRRLRVRNCRFSGGGGAHILISGSIDAGVSGCTFESDVVSSVSGVRTIAATSRTMVEGCSFRGVLYGVNTDQFIAQSAALGQTGQTRGLTVRDCRFETQQQSIVFDSESQYTQAIANEIFVNGSGAVSVAGVDCLVRDNRIFHPGATLPSISVVTEIPDAASRGFGVRVLGNEINGNATAGISYAPVAWAAASTPTLSRLEVTCNSLDNGDISVSLGTSANAPDLTNLKIMSNSAENGQIGVTGNTTGATAVITRAVISQNECSNIDVDGGYSNGITNAEVSRNVSASSPTTTLVKVEDADNVRVSENHLVATATTTICVDVVTANTALVAGNVCANSAAGPCIRVQDTPHVLINGNGVSSVGTAVSVSSSSVAATLVSISSNTISTTTSGVLVNYNTIAGSKNISISNNVILVTAGTSVPVTVTGIADGIAISANVIECFDTSSEAILIIGTGSGDVNNYVVAGNSVKNGNYLVVVTNGAAASDGVFEGNSVHNITQQPTLHTGNITAGGSNSNSP